MSRRHLESALVAGALIESGLSPCFRFRRVRFVRNCYPPGYQQAHSLFDPDNEQTLSDAVNENDPLVSAYENPTMVPNCAYLGLDQLESKLKLLQPIIGRVKDGDCANQLNNKHRQMCRVHMSNYFTRHPWKQLEDDYAIHSVQFTGDGKQLLAGAANTSVRVIQTADGVQRVLPRPSKWTLGMPITAIRFMPPKLNCAIACNSHGEVFAFNSSSEGFETLFKEPQQTYTLDISPDGSELATGGVDRRIRIYTLHPGSPSAVPHKLKDISNNKESPLFRKNLNGTSAEFTGILKLSKSHTTRTIFPGGYPNQIVHATCQPYNSTKCYRSPLNETEEVEPITYAVDGGENDVPPLMEYIPTSPGSNITEGHSKRIMALRYHPQKSSMLITAGWDNLIKIWDTRLARGPVSQIHGPHIASADGMDVDDNYLLTASWRAKSCLEVWDLRSLNMTTGKFRLTYNGPPSNGIKQQITDDRISSTGNLVLTTPLNHTTVHSSSMQNGPAETVPISGPLWNDTEATATGEYLYAAKLLPSRAIAAGGSGFPEIRVLSRDNMAPIVRVPMDSVVQTMDSALEGRYIGVGCASGTVSVIALA